MAAKSRSARVPAWVPYFNVLARRLLALGVPMGPDVLITVRGRTSGQPRSTPITLCENDGRRGLISPFGETDWVRNLRAAGSATLTIARRTEEVTAVELGPSEAAAFVRDVLAAARTPLPVRLVVRSPCRQDRHRQAGRSGHRPTRLRTALTARVTTRHLVRRTEGQALWAVPPGGTTKMGVSSRRSRRP